MIKQIRLSKATDGPKIFIRSAKNYQEYQRGVYISQRENK